MIECKKDFSRELLDRGTPWTLVALLCLAILACISGCKGDNKHSELVGTWRLSAVNGKQLAAHEKGAAELPGFELRDTGTFTMPSFNSVGSWTVEDDYMVMHVEKYTDKTKEQFQKETLAKYPNDPAMQKVAEQVFADMKYKIEADGKALTLTTGANSQTYRRIATRTPSQ